jgi:flavin-dependent dehydrogenase
VDESLLIKSDIVEFISANRLLAKVEGYSELYVTMRFDFDCYLLNLAEGAGTKLELGVRFSKINVTQNKIMMDDDREVEYSVLIGAYGVNSQVAKVLFGSSFNESTIGFGLEIEVPRADILSQSDNVEIDFAAARWGYRWTFPKKKTFTMGVGGIHSRNTDMRSHLARYAAHKALGLSDYKVRGQYIPFGDFRRTPGRGNILLCGDAAGFVDPITGEGIAYAMQTGHAAARAAVAATRKRVPHHAYDYYLVA